MPRKTTRGSALVSSLTVVLIVVMTGAATLAFSVQSMRRGRKDVLRTRALALAEAGVEKATFYLRTIAPDGTNDGSWRTAGLTESVPGQGAYTMIVQDGTGPNAGKIIITATGSASERAGVDGQASSGGSGSFGWSAGGPNTLKVDRTLRVVLALELENVNIWNNAIFGGVGQSGRSINGNVRVRGGVHLLGDGESFTDVDQDTRWDSGEAYTDSNKNGKWDPGEPYVDADGDGRYDMREPWDDVNGNGTRDPALTVTDLSSEYSGDANIGNNYDGMPSLLRDRIVDPPQVPFAGEVVESLKAKLRVKHGRVDISGSATVGEPQQTGGSPPRKETLNGSFVSDGFGGNAGASHVYSDNGSRRGYDLGEILNFPALTDPVVIGGVRYDSYQAYLKSVALIIDGDVRLKPNSVFSRSSGSNSISINADGILRISGIVWINGKFSLARDGGNRQLYYSGRGTLCASDTIAIDTDLIPASGRFPVDHAIGLIARRRIELAKGEGSSQLTLAGAFYAQERVESVLQNEIAGTFVSSYYQMQNVPHLYQVPALVANLPPGMPGSGDVWIKTIRVDSWREVAPA